MKTHFLNLGDFKNSIEEILRLDCHGINQSWSMAQWLDICNHFHNYKVAIAKDSKVLTSFALWHTGDPTCAHLLKITTDNAYLRQGLSSWLLQQANREFQALSFETSYLEVEVSNAAAIRLYEKLGYQILHTKKRFYSDGSEAYAMQLKLN